MVRAELLCDDGGRSVRRTGLAVYSARQPRQSTTSIERKRERKKERENVDGKCKVKEQQKEEQKEEELLELVVYVQTVT